MVISFSLVGVSNDANRRPGGDERPVLPQGWALVGHVFRLLDQRRAQPNQSGSPLSPLSTIAPSVEKDGKPVCEDSRFLKLSVLAFRAPQAGAL